MGLHKIAKQMGYKSNADFYKDFPDETSFLRAMGGDLPKYQFGNFLTSQLLSSQNTGLQEQPQGQVQQEAVMPATDPNALGNQAGFQNTQTGFTGTPVNSTAPQEYAPMSGSTAKTVAKATPYGKIFVPIGESIAGAAGSVIDEEQNPYLHAAVTQAADPSLGLDQAERTAKKFFQPGVDTDTRMVETTSGADILSGSGVGNLAIKPLEKAGVPIHEGFTKQDVNAGTVAGAVVGSHVGLIPGIGSLAPAAIAGGAVAGTRAQNALMNRENGGKLSDGGAIQAGDITAQMIGGQSHEASPMGGTPVDSNGSSTIASGQPAVALAEGGEPAVQFKHADTGEPVSYVFPKNNAEVKKHLKSLERRPNDRTTQTSVNRALTDLMEENEAKNAINSMASLQQAFEPGVPIAKSGINLDPAKKGTFKAMATRMGLSVQAAADKILNAAKGKYSAAMRKKANFAKNFAKEDGGMLNSVLPIAQTGTPLVGNPLDIGIRDPQTGYLLTAEEIAALPVIDDVDNLAAHKTLGELAFRQMSPYEQLAIEEGELDRFTPREQKSNIEVPAQVIPSATNDPTQAQAGMYYDPVTGEIVNTSRRPVPAPMTTRSIDQIPTTPIEPGTIDYNRTPNYYGISEDGLPKYEELGRAPVGRTREEAIMGNIGTAIQALPSLMGLKDIPQMEDPLTRPAPDLVDLTEAKVAAQAAGDRAFSGARRAAGEAGGGRQGLLRRLQSLASSEAGNVGQQLANINIKEKLQNLDLVNRFKEMSFADAQRNREERMQGDAAEFATKLRLKQNVADIGATGIRDENLATAESRRTQQQLLALGMANPDLKGYIDPVTGEFVAERVI